MRLSASSRMSLLAACGGVALALLVFQVATANADSEKSEMLAQAPAAELPSTVAPPSGPAAPPPAALTPVTPAVVPPKVSTEGTPAVVVDGQQVESILGKKVKSTGGDDMGRIVDIIADKAGQVRAAIVDFGGLLGVGSRQIAVDWKAIRFPGEGKVDFVTVDLSRDQLRVAPVYKAGEQIVVLGKPLANDASSAPPPAARSPASEAADPAKPTPPK